MKNNKIHEIFKVALSSVLAVGVFGGALLGVNAATFSSAAERTVELNQVEAMSVTQLVSSGANLPVEDSFAAAAMSTASQNRNLTIVETIAPIHQFFGDESQVPDNIILAKDAAQIAAGYIYDLYEQCIDETVIHMMFNSHMSHRGSSGIWTGTVGDGNVPTGAVEFSADGVPIGKPMFVFIINATTGEMIHIERLAPGLADGMITLYPSASVRVRRFAGIDFEAINPFNRDGSFKSELINPFNEDGTLKSIEEIRELLPDNLIVLHEGWADRFDEIMDNATQMFGEDNFTFFRQFRWYPSDEVPGGLSREVLQGQSK